MRKATKTVATWFGVAAGIAGIEHGYFEILQGNVHPDSLMIVSMGPPCVPAEIWNSCEPAMTILPSFLYSGILSVIIGLVLLIWSIFFVQRRYGGWGMILLSVVLLLFGGGLFPPLIGIVGGVAGIKINKSVKRKSVSNLTRFASRLWPWTLVIFMVWVWGQWIVGYYFNDFLQQVMYFGVLLILVMLPLSIYTAYAWDTWAPQEGE